MRFSILPLAAAIVTLCASCATQSETMPSAAALDQNYQRYLAAAQPEFDELESRRKSGALSQADYEREKSSLEYRVQQRAVDASWTAHSLAESDRRATGIPTPDQPQAIQAGGGGGGSLYRSHNEQYGGSGAQQSFGASGSINQGGQTSLLGGGRSF